MTEDKVAAKWWADTLRHGARMQSTSDKQRQIAPGSTASSDYGDLMGIMLAAEERKLLTAEQIDEFEERLALIVRERFMSGESWDRAQTEPRWGSACRVLMTDYGPCQELSAAFQSVGGRPGATVFPIKTVMWISPGTVKVANGYGAESVELMPQQEPPQ